MRYAAPELVHVETLGWAAQLAANVARDPNRFERIPIEAYSVASVIAREICDVAGLEYPDMRGRPELSIPIFGPWNASQRVTIRRLQSFYGGRVG